MTLRSSHPDGGSGESAGLLADHSPAPEGRTYDLGIWPLAFGYFLFYAPYSALSRATSQGLLPGVEVPSSAFEVLPAIGFTTAVVMTTIVTALGWWRYCGFVSVGRWRLPRPGRRTTMGGLAAAAIINTTTLMFMFRGVSIVLALLIMRGGVLMLAPLLDFAFQRRVRWFAWAGVGLSLCAVGISITVVNHHFSWLLAATAATYLAGYVIRFPCVNAIAKIHDSDARRRYFVEEQLVAMAALVGLPLLLALLGDTTIALHMRHGLTTFLRTAALWPALGIGTLYAALYCCGTLIYLDSRENSFCITLNRAASLLSGVFAAFGLSAFAGVPPPGAPELAGAALILFAILVLSPAHHALEALAVWRCESRPLVPAHQPSAPPEGKSEWR